MTAAELWPAPTPVPGAPLTSLSVARLAYAADARVLSDFSRSMVASAGLGGGGDGLLVVDAVQLVVQARRVLAAAVLVERESGTAWDDIADALTLTDDGGLYEDGLYDTGASQDGPDHDLVDLDVDDIDAAAALTERARRHWEPVVDDWAARFERAAIPDPDRPDVGAVAVLKALAVELDGWVQRHHEPHDPPCGPQPVSAALTPMDPWCELMHLAAVRRRLRTNTVSPDGATIPANADAAAAALDRRAAQIRAALGDPPDAGTADPDRG